MTPSGVQAGNVGVSQQHVCLLKYHAGCSCSEMRQNLANTDKGDAVVTPHGR